MLNKCFSFWLSILLLLLVVDANVVLSLQSPYVWQICHYEGCETPTSSQDLTDEQWAPQQIQSKHIGITVATQRRHKYSTSISSHNILLAMPPSKQFQSTFFARKLLEQYYGSKIWQLDWTDTVAPCSCVSFSHGNHKQTNGKHVSLHVLTKTKQMQLSRIDVPVLLPHQEQVSQKWSHRQNCRWCPSIAADAFHHIFFDSCFLEDDNVWTNDHHTGGPDGAAGHQDYGVTQFRHFL